MWSIFEKDLSTRYHPYLDSLRAVIQSDWTKLDEKVVWRSCASVKAHLKLIIEIKVGHFEILSVHCILRILLKGFAEAFFHSPPGIIFIRVFLMRKSFWTSKSNLSPTVGNVSYSFIRASAKVYFRGVNQCEIISAVSMPTSGSLPFHV